jgi:hypothetical protein
LRLGKQAAVSSAVCRFWHPFSTPFSRRKRSGFEIYFSL